ncbi:class I SAM-dependent rRNA methyltransferase [Nitrosophilus labii]|uniref:class I SAM-dependent rRNA methyltransferase n=1 Tax=Nitrosophilus labii TaxID=2706014 RepID=UPI001656CAB5|nr:class I SAM-dependent rRNA methyltransferase [Nitrosophilus labii]
MKKVVINKKAAKTLREFFPWIYRSDIIDHQKFEAGELVKIVDEEGKSLGIGYINLNSVISIRVLDFKIQNVDKDFFIKRIKDALQQRVDIYSNAFRVIHSEADMLPGLIVDRYDEYLSLQINTAGMLRYKDIILEALVEVLRPKGVVIDADRYSLQKEGVEVFEPKIVGKVPNNIIFEENGIKFSVDITSGQKTGFYLDQRRNREIVSRYIKQKSKVLDLFCNIGGFGLYAAKKADADVELVDISKEAIEKAKNNFKLNNVEGKFVCENVFDYLRVLRAGVKKYDMIIIDPPSFAKNKNQKKGALRGFKDLMVNALKIADNQGYIAIFSCSYYVYEEDLVQIALKASKDTKKRLKIVEVLYQDIDHPYVVNIPTSKYLKGFLFKVL